MGVATIYGLSHAHHKKHFPEKSYKIKTNYRHCFDQKDWLIYSSFYYYCLSCFLWYWFFAMLAVLTYLSIEHKKETLHFFLFFLQICTFFTIQRLLYLFNSQVIYFGEIISYFCINKNSKYSIESIGCIRQIFLQKCQLFINYFASINYPSTKELSDLKIILSF